MFTERINQVSCITTYNQGASYSLSCLSGVLLTSDPEEQLCKGEYTDYLEPTNTAAHPWGLKWEQLPTMKTQWENEPNMLQASFVSDAFLLT